MKYKAIQLETGKFAVGNKKEFYPDSVCDTIKEAKEKAVIKNLQYHYNESWRLFEKLVTKYPDKYGDEKITYGDLSC